MAVSRRKVTTTGELKALAHPVRVDLLELLGAQGPLTATEAAASLAQTPANVSWHLRKLAEHGFVRQARSGPGRRRPWKVVVEALTVTDVAADDAGPPDTTAAALHELAVERQLHVLRRALSSAPRPSDREHPRLALHQTRVRLSAAEAAVLGRRLQEVVDDTVARGRTITEPGQMDPGADVELYAVMSWVAPVVPDER